MKTTFRLVAAALAIAPVGAHATDIVQDGDFEGGPSAAALLWNPTNWSWFPDATAHSGNQEVRTGCFDDTALQDCTISQFLATDTGGVYDLSFWARISSLDPGVKQVRVSWNGDNQIFNLTSTSWTQFTLTGLVAPGPATQLLFGGRDDSGQLYLDDVRVEAAVPEPTSWALMLAGFGALGCALRRHSASASRKDAASNDGRRERLARATP